ncbi:MAG: hypothetical protein ACK558_13695 [Pseudomonadota bacterium]
MSELAVEVWTGPSQVWPLLNDQYTVEHRLKPQPLADWPRVAANAMAPLLVNSIAGSQQVPASAPELPQVTPPSLENDMRWPPLPLDPAIAMFGLVGWNSMVVSLLLSVPSKGPSLSTGAAHGAGAGLRAMGSVASRPGLAGFGFSGPM